MPKGKLITLEGKHSETAKLVAEIREELPYHLENQVIQAQIRRAAFDAYIEQGFTSDQAMDLLKAEIGGLYGAE